MEFIVMAGVIAAAGYVAGRWLPSNAGAWMLGAMWLIVLIAPTSISGMAALWAAILATIPMSYGWARNKRNTDPPKQSAAETEWKVPSS